MKTTAYNDGFLWAKQAHETQELSLEEIEALADANGIDPTDFDAGARAYLREAS